MNNEKDTGAGVGQLSMENQAEQKILWNSRIQFNKCKSNRLQWARHQIEFRIRHLLRQLKQPTRPVGRPSHATGRNCVETHIIYIHKTLHIIYTNIHKTLDISNGRSQLVEKMEVNRWRTYRTYELWIRNYRIFRCIRLTFYH